MRHHIKTYLSRAILLTTSALASIQTSAASNNNPVKASDLAVIMTSDFLGLNAASNPNVFPEQWYKKVLNSFQNTSIGRALENENKFKDWQMVGYRVVPCAPLGLSPKDDIDTWCWPEVRVIWQPIVILNRVPGRVANYADDRAIHILYGIDPSLYLSTNDATRAASYLRRIKAALNERQTNILNTAEKADFIQLQNLASQSLLIDAISIRKAQPIDTIEARPEFQRQESARPFVINVKNFLDKTTQIDSAYALTAFSLPEGRDPASIDEWVFVKFGVEFGELRQEEIGLNSAANGKQILNLGFAPRGTMLRDDPLIYDYLQAIQNPEVEQNVILWANSSERSHIADRQQILVPNTTCASCHKLMNERFNFHAMSYLGQDMLEVSPRVQRDVELDLDWIARKLNF